MKLGASNRDFATLNGPAASQSNRLTASANSRFSRRRFVSWLTSEMSADWVRNSILMTQTEAPFQIYIYIFPQSSLAQGQLVFALYLAG